MNRTKQKLRRGQSALGGWVMIGHPTVVEIMAGDDRLDWLAVDMEHATTTPRMLYELCLAAKGTGKDVLVRLPSHDAALIKLVLDTGAAGIIAPSVNTARQAEDIVAMAKFPPLGHRGAGLSRASGFGRNFADYYAGHNDNVLVVCMIEHIDAVENIDSILAVDGIDATFIGPYDLSTSMGLAGQVDHPDVVAAQSRVLAACNRHGVPAGIHVLRADGRKIQARIQQGFRFVGCSVDTELIMASMTRMMDEVFPGQDA